MTLQFTRAKLSMRLMMIEPDSCSEQDANYLCQDIDDWFGHFKAWEKADSFPDALKQHRMTARVVAKFATTTKNVTDNKLSMNRYDMTGHKLLPAKKQTTDVYNTTLAGMKLRTDPTNFGPDITIPGGIKKVDGKIVKVADVTRGKYNLGLHDMSAVLLSTQRGSLFNQLAWRESVKETEKFAVAFMPLPLELDLQLFVVLNGKAKRFRGTKYSIVYEKVALIRRQMTRVKLANEVDAGSGFVNVGTGWTAQTRKYKYGLGLVAIPDKTGAVGVQEAMRRSMLALEYRSLLNQMPPMPEDTSKPGTNNELVIAYRAHESKHFPMFTVYNEKQACFDVFDGPIGCDINSLPKTIPNGM